MNKSKRLIKISLFFILLIIGIVGIDFSNNFSVFKVSKVLGNIAQEPSSSFYTNSGVINPSSPIVTDKKIINNKEQSTSGGEAVLVKGYDIGKTIGGSITTKKIQNTIKLSKKPVYYVQKSTDGKKLNIYKVNKDNNFCKDKGCITLDRANLLAKNGFVSNTDLNNKFKTCQDNPDKCSISKINFFQNQNKHFESKFWSSVTTSASKTKIQLDDCLKQSGGNCDNLQTSYDNLKGKVLSNNNIVTTINSLSPEQQKTFTKIYNNKNTKCSLGIDLISSICSKIRKKNTEDIALISYQKQLDLLQNSKFKELNKLGYNTNLLNTAKKNLDKCHGNKKSSSKCLDKEKIFNKAHNLLQLKMAIKGSNILGSNKCDNYDNCLKQVKSNCQNNNDKNINCKIILKNINYADSKSLVQTNMGYQILHFLANPDRNALRATKLFGIEPDYSNVPKMLKEPIASQICSAKIDGYLDKTIKNSNGGITSYGCDKTYTLNYNKRTNQSKLISSNPNCIHVTLDLRSQRTQITMDNKVSITYSLYLKAPKNRDIKYFLAIKYKLKNRKTFTQLIKPSQNSSIIKKGDIGKEFDTINLKLNNSRNNIIDSKFSFSIAILAIFPDKSIYMHKSTPSVLISGTDTYFNINDNTNSQNSNSNSNPTKNKNSATTSPQITSKEILKLI